VVVVVAVSGSLGGKEVDMCMTHLVQEEMACTERIQVVTLQVGGGCACGSYGHYLM
jgi:hypothetical protein